METHTTLANCGVVCDVPSRDKRSAEAPTPFE
jgi:hypothetical protein